MTIRKLLRFPVKAKVSSKCFTDDTTSQDGITYPWQNDACGLVQEASEEWIAVTGQSRAEACGFGWARVVHPDDRDGLLRKLFKAFGSATPATVEFRILTIAGEYVKVKAHTEPVFDNDGHVTAWRGRSTIFTKYPSQVIKMNSWVF